MSNSPLSNELQELAAGYVLDDLDSPEVVQVERLMQENPAFLAEIKQLQAVTAIMVSSVPQQQPPAGLLDKIMAEISPTPQVDLSQVLVNLGQWFDNIFEPLWQPPESLNLAFSAWRTTELQEATIKRGKLIEWETDHAPQAVILLATIANQTEGKVSVSFQLYPSSAQNYLPENIELNLLSTSGEVLRLVKARSQDNYIRLPRFTVNSGFEFSLQIKLEQFSLTEQFVV